MFDDMEVSLHRYKKCSQIPHLFCKLQIINFSFCVSVGLELRTIFTLKLFCSTEKSLYNPVI